MLVAAVLAVEDVEALFLDEPTAGLDPVNRMRLCSALQYRVHRDGIRVLLTSHNMNEVEQLASEVLMINRGKLVAKGAPSTLISALSSFVRIELHCRDLERYRRSCP